MSRYIPLSKGKVAIVDDEDFDRIASLSWYARRGVNTYYAERRGPRNGNGKRRTYSMHRTVLELGEFDGQVVDHINRNGLDNRKANLRLTDKRGNALNSARAREPRGCETCGQDYMPGSKGSRYCSSSCSRRRPNHPREQRVLPDRICPTCSETFRPHNHRTKYCSRACSNRGRSKKLGLR